MEVSMEINKRNNNAQHNENANDNNENNRAENPTRSALDELIQEDSKLKKYVEAAQESKRKWRIRNTTIDNSNWKLDLEVNKLGDRTDRLRNEIVAKSEESQRIHDDLEIYRSRNRQEAADFWSHFQEEVEKYSNLFTNGHIEYSSDCLKQDIEEYRRQSQVVRGMIETVEKEMEALKAQYGLPELGTNEKINLLADIDTAKKTISDKDLLLRATKSAEDNIEVLKLKVKQKKDDIDYLKTKTYKK